MSGERQVVEVHRQQLEQQVADPRPDQADGGDAPGPEPVGQDARRPGPTRRKPIVSGIM